MKFSPGKFFAEPSAFYLRVINLGRYIFTGKTAVYKRAKKEANYKS